MARGNFGGGDRNVANCIIVLGLHNFINLLKIIELHTVISKFYGTSTKLLISF
jgi:hypothetical protein